MSKKLPSYICRKSENTDMIKCICGNCRAEKAEAKIADLEATIAQGKRLQDADNKRIKEPEKVVVAARNFMEYVQWDEPYPREREAKRKQLETALSHLTPAGEADGNLKCEHEWHVVPPGVFKCKKCPANRFGEVQQEWKL